MNKRLENAFVLAKCLEEIGGAWFFATYGLFLLSIRLNEWEYVGVNIVFMVTKTLLDPITGNIGDRFGQKRVYLWGIFMWALGLFLYGFAKNFIVCALAETLSGIGAALISEALESWLKNLTDEDTSHRAQTRAGYWARLATIPTAIIGGIVGAKFGLQWPWIIGGISTLLTGGVTWYLLKSYKDKVVEHVFTDADLNLWTISKRAWRDLPTRKIFILAGLTSACFMPLNMYWQRVFLGAGVDPSWMGITWIGVAVFTAFGFKSARKIKVSSKNLALVIVSIGIPLYFPQFLKSMPVLLVIMFWLHEIGRGMINPVTWTYYNRRVGDKTRASENSLKSAAGSLGAVLGLGVSAALTFVISLSQIWAISAIALISIALWVRRWNHDN